MGIIFFLSVFRFSHNGNTQLLDIFMMTSGIGRRRKCLKIKMKIWRKRVKILERVELDGSEERECGGAQSVLMKKALDLQKGR